MKSKARRIVVDGVAYQWTARWRYDIDGRRVVTLTVAFETEAPSRARAMARPASMGPMLRVNLAASSPGYVDTSYTTPGDVRAVHAARRIERRAARRGHLRRLQWASRGAAAPREAKGRARRD